MKTLALKYTLSKTIKTYKEHQLNNLLESLIKHKISINDNVVKKNAVISSFIKTNEAINKAESKEKFDFLLSLYANGFNSGDIFNNIDQYNETIQSLGDMSHREISFIYLLDNYTKNNNESTIGFSKFNDELSNLFHKELKLNNEEQESMTRRLYRTGFILSVTTMDGGLWPRVSPLYKDVLHFINQEWDSTRLILT